MHETVQICHCLKTILSSIRFLTRQEISLRPKRLKSGPKRIKTPLKTHITGIIPFSDCGEFAASLVSGVVSFMMEGRVGSVKG